MCLHGLDELMLTAHPPVAITDPEMALEILQKFMDKPPFVYNILIPLIGQKSLVLVGGALETPA